MTAFQKLRVYQSALVGVQMIYRLTNQPQLSKDFALKDQVRRASLSVIANIAEGYGRNTVKDKRRFLTISIGSLNEVLAFLDVVEKIYSYPEVTKTRDFYISLGKQIWAFRQSIKS
jgi:four helix bundle protein